MRLSRVAALIVLVVLVAGCGGSGGTAKRRHAVNDYFGRVDRAEAELVKKSAKLSAALQSFTPSSTTPRELQGLVSARTTIRTALRRVRALTPPPDAVAFHADLLRLLVLQERLADELVWSARFVPRFAAAVRPLATAAGALGRDLAAVKPPAPASGGGDQVFAAAGCGGCHALAAAGANGKAGPDLDRLRPSADAVRAVVESGHAGMPSLRHSLTPAQIAAVASFVASSAGRPAGAAPPSSGGSGSSPAGDVLQQYAAAFARYRSAIAPVTARLDRLAAPPLLRPALAAEQRAAHRSSELCVTIEAALRKRDVAGANAAIASLFGVAAGVGGAETRRNQAAAVRVYDARVARIGTLAAKLAAERQRLVRLVG